MQQSMRYTSVSEGNLQDPTPPQWISNCPAPPFLYFCKRKTVGKHVRLDIKEIRTSQWGSGEGCFLFYLRVYDIWNWQPLCMICKQTLPWVWNPWTSCHSFIIWVCTLGRFIKSKFWKFDISTHFLCDKYHDKEKVQKKFCSNIAPSIGTGHPLNPPFLHSKTRPKYAKYVK